MEGGGWGCGWLQVAPQYRGHGTAYRTFIERVEGCYTHVRRFRAFQRFQDVFLNKKDWIDCHIDICNFNGVLINLIGFLYYFYKNNKFLIVSRSVPEKVFSAFVF